MGNSRHILRFQGCVDCQIEAGKEGSHRTIKMAWFTNGKAKTVEWPPSCAARATPHDRGMLRSIAILLVCLPVAARAAETPTVQMHLSFSAYAAGLNVIDLKAGIEMTPAGYRVATEFRTTGLFGALIHAQTESIAAGAWRPTGVAPTRFYSYGTVRGQPRRTQIDFEGGQPILKILEPQSDEPRDPIAPEQLRNTIDTLSALADLVHTVVVSGQCGGRVTTFDGRRLSEIAVHKVGEQVLQTEGRSIFAGPALRCDFEGRQTGGFAHDLDRAELSKPQVGSAWLAPALPGGPPVPVRMSFHTRYFGDATMYLTEAAPGPLPQ
jgi:hypothetical protein